MVINEITWNKDLCSELQMWPCHFINPLRTEGGFEARNQEYHSISKLKTRTMGNSCCPDVDLVISYDSNPSLPHFNRLRLRSQQVSHTYDVSLVRTHENMLQITLPWNGWVSGSMKQQQYSLALQFLQLGQYHWRSHSQCDTQGKTCAHMYHKTSKTTWCSSS